MALIPNVSPNELIESAWGNTIRDHVIQTFANTAARDAWSAAPDGAFCVTTDTYTKWMRRAGAWVKDGGSGTGLVYNGIGYTSIESGDTGSTPTSIMAQGVNMIAGHTYDIRSYTTIVSRATTGGQGALLSLKAGTFIINQIDRNIINNYNVNYSCDMTGLWQSGTTGSVSVSVEMSKSWYSAGGPRYIRGPGIPFGLVVIDLGV